MYKMPFFIAENNQKKVLFYNIYIYICVLSKSSME